MSYIGNGNIDFLVILIIQNSTTLTDLHGFILRTQEVENSDNNNSQHKKSCAGKNEKLVSALMTDFLFHDRFFDFSILFSHSNSNNRGFSLTNDIANIALISAQWFQGPDAEIARRLWRSFADVAFLLWRCVYNFFRNIIKTDDAIYIFLQISLFHF